MITLNLREFFISVRLFFFKNVNLYENNVLRGMIILELYKDLTHYRLNEIHRVLSIL